MSAIIQASQFIMIPIDPKDALPGAIFLDKTNANSYTIKSIAGVTSPIANGSSNPNVKLMQSAGVFNFGSPLAKLPDGRVVLCESDGVGHKNFIGIALQKSEFSGAPVNVFTIGVNVSGILKGANFSPGDRIYVGESGEYINNLRGLVGGDDDYIMVGIADCAGGPTASSEAEDLIMLVDKIANFQ